MDLDIKNSYEFFLFDFFDYSCYSIDRVDTNSHSAQWSDRKDPKKKNERRKHNMENVFESVLGASTPDTQSDDAVESTNNTSELGEEYNLTLPEDTDDTSEDEGSDATQDEDFEESNPTNQAFAQMRTQNKEYLNKINELDAIAKAAGLQGVDDLIAKSKEAQIKKAAK